MNPAEVRSLHRQLVSLKAELEHTGRDPVGLLQVRARLRQLRRGVNEFNVIAERTGHRSDSLGLPPVHAKPANAAKHRKARRHRRRESRRRNR